MVNEGIGVAQDPLQLLPVVHRQRHHDLLLLRMMVTHTLGIATFFLPCGRDHGLAAVVQRNPRLSLLDEKGAVEDVFDGGGEAVSVEDEGEVVDGLLPATVLPELADELRERGLDEDLGAVLGALGGLYKNRSSRKIDSKRLFSRECDFRKTFSLTENQFSGKTYFYTIPPWSNCIKIGLPGKSIHRDYFQ